MKNCNIQQVKSQGVESSTQNMAGWKILLFYVGNTSTPMVHYVSLPECNFFFFPQKTFFWKKKRVSKRWKGGKVKFPFTKVSSQDQLSLSHKTRSSWSGFCNIFRQWNGDDPEGFTSKVVSTHLTGTHLYQTSTNRQYSGIPFIVSVGKGLPNGCGLGVCCNFLGELRLMSLPWLQASLTKKVSRSNTPTVHINHGQKTWGSLIFHWNFLLV